MEEIEEESVGEYCESCTFSGLQASEKDEVVDLEDGVFESQNSFFDLKEDEAFEELDDFDLEEEIKARRRKQLRAHWKRPGTKVYADNFGFSVNGYQPMIDYLDQKDSGCCANKSDIHLPYLEERCMNKYCSQKPFKFYSNKDIDKFIEKGEKIRTQIRQNDALGLSNVHRRTHTNWSMTRKFVQLVKQSYVVDYRKLHGKNSENLDCESEKSCDLSSPKTLVDIIASYLPNIDMSDLESKNLVSAFILTKRNHEQEMALRRQRLQALDDEYEKTINKLSSTLDRINQRAESLPRIVSSEGSVYHPQDMIDVADDLIHTNRRKRQDDLYRLARDVNLRSSGNRYSLGDSVLGDDEMFRVDPTLVAIAKRNAHEAVQARNIRSTRSMSVHDEESEVDELRRRYLKGSKVEDTELLPARKPKKENDDLVSDVQTRVLNRAREMAGVTHEARRINNRARFVNVISPRPKTGDVKLRIPPSKTERNIVKMATTLAYNTTTKPMRVFDVEEEMDKPVSNLNTYANRMYCEREFEKPVPRYPSDSRKVRDATIRARTRNALLGY